MKSWENIQEGENKMNNLCSIVKQSDEVKKRIFLTIWLLTSLLFYIIPNSYAQMTEEVSSILDTRSSEIEANLNNWKALKTILLEIRGSLSGVPTCEIEAPLRLLYGHVALATNENNVAVEQFYCGSDSSGSKSLNDWLTWTERLVKKVPNSATSHYLYGDALARYGNFFDAKNEFDKALEIDPKHTLSLNARGIVKWLISKKDSSMEEYELEAIQDLIDASKYSPEFADAFANRGVIGLLDETGLERARELFDQALNIDNSYWLALNGKAVTYGASGEYWNFQKIIDRIKKQAPNTPFLEFNTGNINKEKLAFLGARGASGIEWKFGIDLNLKMPGVLGKFLPSADINFEIGRGGIFMYLKEGENLKKNNDGELRQAGTWFALNYPIDWILSSEE
ncbi:MAG: tetratricopeptide repeat protein [Ignavibacteria bacterium]|nr:MAG: tetratricopeptide repeat protein [Ignavibacteria bacterium]